MSPLPACAGLAELTPAVRVPNGAKPRMGLELEVGVALGRAAGESLVEEELGAGLLIRRQEDRESSFWRLLADKLAPNNLFALDVDELILLLAPLVACCCWLSSLLRLNSCCLLAGVGAACRLPVC